MAQPCLAGADHDSDFFMVKDIVWAAAGLKHYDGWICVPCLERRLGRPLTVHDWQDCEATNQFLYDRGDDAARVELLRQRGIRFEVTDDGQSVRLVETDDPLASANRLVSEAEQIVEDEMSNPAVAAWLTGRW